MKMPEDTQVLRLKNLVKSQQGTISNREKLMLLIPINEIRNLGYFC